MNYAKTAHKLPKHIIKFLREFLEISWFDKIKV